MWMIKVLESAAKRYRLSRVNDMDVILRSTRPVSGSRRILPYSLPVNISHKRTEPSKLPVANLLPSLDNATAATASECPSNRQTSLPVATSQIRAVLSPLPVTSHFISLLKTRQVTL